MNNQVSDEDPGQESRGYVSKSFWEDRLGSHTDLAGTGEPGLSLSYNRACYRLREHVLARELDRAGVELTGANVLDVGSGVGFFVDFYLRRAARVTAVELTEVGTRYLEERFPEARVKQGDVVDCELDTDYDVVNAFDVLYHIVEENRWQQALRRIARALRPQGLLLLTDVLSPVKQKLAAHNVMRDRMRYQDVLSQEGVVVLSEVPTHYLLNRELGLFRGLNRMPSLLYAIDRTLMALSAPAPEPTNRLLVARRQGSARP